MNLLLLTATELDSRGHLWLEGERARHLLTVLAVQAGQQLRAGCLDQSLGTATVLTIETSRIEIRYEPRTTASRDGERCLLLAIPRPKVLSRCLEHAAALGFTRIALMRTARVEKSHLHSHKLLAHDIRPHLIAGLEQGMRVLLPEVRIFNRFKPFVEDELNDFVPTEARFVGHPHAAQAIGQLPAFDPHYCIALGPEGGFVPFEINALEQQGFVAVRAAMGPLRVESALSYLTGQLDLMARAPS